MSDSITSSGRTNTSACPPPAAINSSADSVSRAEPPPCSTAWRIASGDTSSLASLTTQRTCSSRSFAGNRRNCRCCVRLRMVSLTFCGSVVASTNTTCGGGSSSVFNNAASAPALNMCTSSRMNTRWRPGLPIAARSMSSRMLSTPLLLAASSSSTSKLVPRSIDRHDSHSQHGSPWSGFMQLSTLARMRAAEVLPVPRGPENMYACPPRSLATALRSARTTCSWPFSSPKRRGR